jgi:hypothetical protein
MMYTCQSSACDNVRQCLAGDTKAAKRKKESSGATPKKRPPKSKALPFAQGSSCPSQECAGKPLPDQIDAHMLFTMRTIMSAYKINKSPGTLGAHDGRQCLDCRLHCTMLRMYRHRCHCKHSAPGDGGLSSTACSSKAAGARAKQGGSCAEEGCGAA